MNWTHPKNFRPMDVGPGIQGVWRSLLGGRASGWVVSRGQNIKRRTLVLGLALVLMLSLGSCDKKKNEILPPQSPEGRALSHSPPNDSTFKATIPSEEGAPIVVVLGDSLTAGLGLPEEMAFPTLLEALIREAGYPHKVVNAGVSGDTAQGGWHG